VAYKIEFGTDGWRGVIADDFTYERIWLVANAVAKYVSYQSKGRPKLVIGYDTRFGSDRFAQLCAIAAASQGVEVMISGTFVPTPAVSYAVVDEKADGAIMITASHNPSAYDGIKFKAPYGGSASTTITAEIERELRLVENDPPPMPDVLFADVVAKGDVEVFDPRPAYIKQIVSMIDADVFSNWKDMKIMFDPMYGAGQGIMSKALSEIGMTCEEIHGVHNPLFPGLHPEPIGANLDDLKAAVVEGQCDVGIAVDGDADRVTAVDATGRFISSHMVFALLLKHLVEVRHWSGAVVKTVSTTTMIDRLCDKYGLKLYVVPVGFKYIADLMLQEDILIGGEESGGTGIKNHIPERDGALVGMLLCEIMATHHKTLGQQIDELMEDLGRKFVFLRKDIILTQSEKEDLIKRLHDIQPESIGSQKVTNIETIDGYKFHLEDGSWLMLRVSGTEPVVRIYSESTSSDEVEKLVALGLKLIKGIEPEV